MDNVLELSNAEIRQLAADKIQQQGLARMKYECPDTGALCMMGAIRRVIFGQTDVWNFIDARPSDPRVTRYQDIVQELNAELPPDFWRGDAAMVRIGKFNDGNDKDTVVKVLAGKPVVAQDV